MKKTYGRTSLPRRSALHGMTDMEKKATKEFLDSVYPPVQKRRKKVTPL